MSTTNRVAKNTLILYLRLLLTAGLTLFTLRIVLITLGVEDFGIYSVVGGLVAMLSFLPATMASATQRYFSFALGKKDEKALYATFTVNWALYTAIALTALALLETAGLWYVKTQLRIPPERFEEALALYHYSSLTFVASIFTSPFIAILIAHENMRAYASISIADAVLKLAAAYALTLSHDGTLELYGLLLLSIAVLNAVTYITICVYKYDECQFRKFHWNPTLLREILGFTGWTLFGQFTTAMRNHAVTILLNQAFNPTVVASRAIALQVKSAAIMFSTSFNTSLYPPIVKSYAADNRNEMYDLVYAGCRVTFYLMWVIALPLLVEMPALLSMWLKEIPPETTTFARLTLIEALITSVSLPLMTAARASGTMRVYEATLGVLQLAILPASWVTLQIWKQPWTVFAVGIAVNAIMFQVRLHIVNYLVGLPISDFFRKVGSSILLVTASSGIASVLISATFRSIDIHFTLSLALSFGVTGACIYCWGLDATWKIKIRAIVAQKLGIA